MRMAQDTWIDGIKSDCTAMGLTVHDAVLVTIGSVVSIVGAGIGFVAGDIYEQERCEWLNDSYGTVPDRRP